MFLKQFQLYKKNNLHGRSEKLYINLFFTLFLGGLIFGGKFVLVIRGAYIQVGLYSGGAYIQDFTVVSMN